MFKHLKDNVFSVFNAAASKPEKRDSVSLQEAFDVFDRLADNPDIAFGYAPDGCYARAHLMCREMQKLGIVPKKSWAFESDEGRLRFLNAEGKLFQWWYHVAAALTVEMPDGQKTDMVIDPGMFDGPVTLKEWGDAMEADADKLSIVDFGKPAPNYTGDYGPHQKTDANTDSSAESIMKTYLPYQAKEPRTLLCSNLRQQTIQTQQFKITSQGKSWQTKNSQHITPVEQRPGMTA